jgi:hypothetical protein
VLVLRPETSRSQFIPELSLCGAKKKQNKIKREESNAGETTHTRKSAEGQEGELLISWSWSRDRNDVGE